MCSKRIIRNILTDVPEPVILKNKISGTVNEASNSDKTVWAYDRLNGELLGATIVNRDTRQWELYTDPNHTDESITLICRDEGGDYNGDIYDRVSLCNVEYAHSPAIMGLVTYPSRNICSYSIRPNLYNTFCTYEVPELKGDIVKIVQNGDYDSYNLTYPVKYINAGGNEIVNDVTSNNVIVNDESVVLNKNTRSHHLKVWRKNIFEDNSEILHPVWNGTTWVNHYDGIPCASPFSTPTKEDPLIGIGDFGEAAICVPSQRTDLYDYQGNVGTYFNLDTSNVHAMSVSFWVKSAGLSNNNYLSDAYYLMQQSVVQLSARFGFTMKHCKENYWNNGVYRNTGLIGVLKDDVTELTKSGIIDLGINAETSAFHATLVYTSTSLDLYINGDLKQTLLFSNNPLRDSHTLFVGRGAHTRDFTQYWCGLVSGLRVFNRAITVEEISQLYADRPVLEKEVLSIKGMEHDSGVLSLGGVPYKPLIKLDKTYNKDDYSEFNFGQGTISVDLLEDCVRFWGYSYQSGYYTGLSSRPDADNTYDMDIDISGIDLYMRIFLEDTGYMFKIGNASKCIFMYNYAPYQSNQMVMGYTNIHGYNVLRYFNKTAACNNTWIRLKWIHDTIYIYEDDGETLILEYTSPEFSVWSETKGQISIGCNRGGSWWDTPSDIYGGRLKVSDFYIYEKGTMDSAEPILKYEFGSQRGRYSGLCTTHSVVGATNGFEKGNENVIDDWSIYTRSVAHYYTGEETHSEVRRKTSNLDKGYSYMFNIYPYIENGVGNAAHYIFSVQWCFGAYTLFNPAHIRYTHPIQDNAYYSSVANMEVYSNVDVSSNKWMHVGCSVDFRENQMIGYSQGNAINSNWGAVPYRGGQTSDKIVINEGYRKFNIAFLNVYDAVLPPSMFRNASQNYFGECYKDEMLVAFVDEATEYPVYSGIPLNSIHVEGDTNGQVLTFACTKDHINYYVFNNGWKKILTKEGDFWMYWDGSIWQNGGIVKWKAASMAMDIVDNRMTLDRINSLSAVQLNTLHDLAVGTFDLAVGMKSNGTISPYIDRITYNNERLWLSPVYNLADFDNTNYDTKVYLHKCIPENTENGIKVFVHTSNEAGWQECPNFSSVPGVVKNGNNTGTIQFKVTFDQNKPNGKDKALFSVTIK